MSKYFPSSVPGRWRWQSKGRSFLVTFLLAILDRRMELSCRLCYMVPGSVIKEFCLGIESFTPLSSIEEEGLELEMSVCPNSVSV